MSRKESRLRICGVTVLLMAGFLLLAGNALAKHSHSRSLLNTVWTGDITVLDVSGNTTVLAASSLTFLTESADFKFLSGTISAPAISFSAIRSGDDLNLGAVGYVMSADIDDHNGDHSKRGDSATLRIQGSNVTDGSTFVGTLRKQQ